MIERSIGALHDVMAGQTSQEKEAPQRPGYFRIQHIRSGDGNLHFVRREPVFSARGTEKPTELLGRPV